MEKTVLILGASGKLGSSAAQAFAASHWQVRKYDRTTGDMVAAARGANVIVNGLNPPTYHDWARIIPAITRDVIAAAKASGAAVLVPGNVYNLGDQGGEWSESTVHRPNTHKGQIREDMERAYEASGVQTIIVRAGNFITKVPGSDVMGLLLLRSIQSGKVTVAGAPDAMQAYCYLPDWARAAVALSEKLDQLAQFEDIPFPGHSFTAEQLRTFLSAELGRELGLQYLPWWLMTALSPFWEMAREMREMRYLWSTSHTLSGAKFGRLLPEFQPSSLAEVMRAGLPEALKRQTSRRN